MNVPEPYAGGVSAARDYYEELQAERETDRVFLSPPLGTGSQLIAMVGASAA